ncbi:MAG: biotin/lipoyl-binding protein, partial [Gemmatimonadales bacterium]
MKGGIAAGAILLLTVLVSSLKPAAPPVDRDTIVVDTVRRGPMVRDVRGPGSLIPEHIRWISSLTPARVERIFVQAGTPVQPGTVLLELANPDVQIEELEAQRQLTAAQADLVNLRTTLESQRLTQQGLVATTRTDYMKAKRDAEVAETLGVRGGVSRNDVDLARDRAAELEARYGIERQRLDLLS